ncbi:MAG: type II secretion system protein [Phycisphaerales bacterium]
MRRATRTTRGAFSLVEIIVAVGAFAIVAVAISSIFGSVGDTISAGRRQSRLNSYAAQIERVMRADFERMTRDGFLVIRHEYAIRAEGGNTDSDNDGYPDRLDIPAFPGDQHPRPRRVDQIMFFERGSFTSARTEVQPGFTPESSEARVLYGHGQRKPKAADLDATHLWYSEPRLDDDMQGRTSGPYQTLPSSWPVAGDRLGFDPGPGLVNPNEFAQDWTLLRHVTLLVPVSDTGGQPLPDFGNDGLFGLKVNRATTGGDRAWVADSEFQVALQPAVSGVFWTPQKIVRADSQAGDTTKSGYVRALDSTVSGWVPRVVDVANTEPAAPDEVLDARTASGLVDVATTSLSEIESIVTGVDHMVINMAPNGKVTNLSDFEYQARRKGYPYSVAVNAEPGRWMLDTLPGAPVEGWYGDWTKTNFGGVGLEKGDRTTARVRYEPTPPDLNAGVVDASDSDLNRLKGVYKQADQELLTRWAFVPRCTEFIVEWSYGWVYGPSTEFPKNAGTAYNVPVTDPRYRQLVWFGHERRTLDTNGDGVIDKNDELTTREYFPRTTAPSDAIDSQPGDDPRRNLITGHGTGQIIGATPPQEPETYVFGYFLPPVNAGTPGALTQFKEWPWPKLIRVTMTIADPGDPSIETTVQAVFEVPDPEG